MPPLVSGYRCRVRMWTKCGRAANHRATAMERIRAAVVGDHRDGWISSASLMQSRINGWRR
jgi:hypothetical protein